MAVEPQVETEQQTRTISSGEPILDQFLGDESFPIEWRSEREKELFWVFDDLHCPHPLSPMFEEIGGWWLSCDHMFRRFGTPFAADWIIKNVNGYLYTAAVPADPELEGRRHGVRRALRRTGAARRQLQRAHRQVPRCRRCPCTAPTSRTGGAIGWCPKCSAISIISRPVSTARTR